MMTRLASGFLLLSLLLLVGCTDRKTTLTVFAASSLTDAFAEMELVFERANPEIDVVLNTAGSQTLRLQIEQGARVDLFASANTEHMDALRAAGYLLESTIFAHNTLTVVVPERNPANLTTFTDLPNASRVVLGHPEVPIGRYARRVLDGAGMRDRVEARVVSTEPNVRLVLAKVEIGEADAALVYTSDVTRRRRVRTIPIPPHLNVRADYHLGLLKPSTSQAALWLAFIASPAGRSVLERHGFKARPSKEQGTFAPPPSQLETGSSGSSARAGLGRAKRPNERTDGQLVVSAPSVLSFDFGRQCSWTL